MAKSERTKIANWGNYPRAEAQVFYPENRDSVQAAVSQIDRLIARGNGKCYGDAALAPQIVSTLALNRLIDFDPQSGVIHCEAGLLLADLLEIIVPAGWFFQVTPGIKNITVGGAIASDVHGKNHLSKGCFSNWLEDFELLCGNNEIVRCSRTENADLFWQSCGGMGWTGLILTARFRLMKIPGIYMRQNTVRAENLEGLFQAFDQQAQFPYAAAWIDVLAGGTQFGRGVGYFAEHAESDDDSTGNLEYPHKSTRNVPFYAPSGLLNRWTIWAHNQMLFSKAQSGEQRVDLDRYFYPLDRIRNWNRLYGRRGFIQYQFCLPEEFAFAGIREVLQTIRKSGDLPFLTVLKRHGERPAVAINSFPIRGYSLALDFPRTRTVFALARRLDEIVWQYEGKIYLAKDSCSAGHMSRVDPSAFGEAKFCSFLKERISNC